MKKSKKHLEKKEGVMVICGCRFLAGASGKDRIEFCRLHGFAPALLAAIKGLLTMLETPGPHNKRILQDVRTIVSLAECG